MNVNNLDLKSLGARTLFRSGVYRLFLRDTAFVVLFHRVDSTLGPGPLTVTEGQFADYCAFLAEYFDVITLKRLLSKLKNGTSLNGDLVITFDDGYRDNWLNAAPILKQLGLPATFFLSTGYIGSERVPAWDRQLDDPPKWMTWEHVEKLNGGSGFSLGAHTRDHADLGGISGKWAESQIRESAIDLERHVGTRPRLFSFPFGRPVNITEANRQTVRRLGFHCCLSAFGGTVRPDTSLYRIPRMPVSNWYEDPFQFGGSLLRERFATY